MTMDAGTFTRLREIAAELSALPTKPVLEIGPQGLVMTSASNTVQGAATAERAARLTAARLTAARLAVGR